MKTNRLLRLTGIFTIVVFFSSCIALDGVQQSSRGGKRLEYVIKGQGSPSLVFETGMGPTIVSWNPILDSLSQHSKVYAYNRPGYGRSNLKYAPKTVTEVAQQLHANLIANEVRPPYLLVGHSLGGLYVNMFARLYPEEVMGVVFLDASHPEQFEYFKNHQDLIYLMLTNSIQNSQRLYELDIIQSANSIFLNAPEFPEVPVAVLTAGKPSMFGGKAMRKQWLLFQEDLAALSKNSDHIVVKGSGHYIQREAPGLTIAKILKILNQDKEEAFDTN